MPMQLTVSRHRKRSANYNSEGYGVSLTVELDQGLLEKPEDLQDRIARLYREADQALDQQATAHARGRSRTSTRRLHAHENRPEVSAPTGDPAPLLTPAQKRAISAISRRIGCDPIEECRRELSMELEELTVKQASGFIDHLNRLEREAGMLKA